jgi:hypothetical protein
MGGLAFTTAPASALEWLSMMYLVSKIFSAKEGVHRRSRRRRPESGYVTSEPLEQELLTPQYSQATLVSLLTKPPDDFTPKLNEC